MLRKLIAILLAPFRFHDYDYENVQIANIEKIGNNQEQAFIQFFAVCKNCAKRKNVSRETYISIKTTGWVPCEPFCVRDPVKRARWEEEHELRQKFLCISPGKFLRDMQDFEDYPPMQ